MNKLKICLVTVVNRNFGDGMIAGCTEDMIKKNIPEKYKDHYQIIRYDIKRDDPILIKSCDMVIFAGGGMIKYQVEGIDVYVEKIIDWASEAEIPVYFNAVGVEGFDDSSDACLRLKEALNKDVVKGITVRDDYWTLKKKYIINPDIETYPVYDSAAFCNRICDSKKDEESDVIGLGIVRWDIFTEYNRLGITKEKQIRFWMDVIEGIEAKGYRWQLFVNGAEKDYEAARELLKLTGKDDSLLPPRPISEFEVADTLAGYRGIIAERLHSCIIAMALGVPAVGLNWNDKIPFWFEKNHCEERYVETENFHGQAALEKLWQALDEGVEAIPEEDYVRLVTPLKHFISASADRKEMTEQVLDADWSGRLMATALGAIGKQYFNMNNLAAYEDAKGKGFKNYEVDIRLTSDHRLVCVNGWSKDTYRKLGISPVDGTYKALNEAEFFRTGYYDGHYKATGFKEFVDQVDISQLEELYVDIGIPGKALSEEIIKGISEIATSDSLLEKMIVRLASGHDVEFMKQYLPGVQIAYQIPADWREKNVDLKKLHKYLKANGIRRVTFTRKDEVMEDESIDFFQKRGYHTCIFTCNTYTLITKALERNIDLIGTSFCSVEDAGTILSPVPEKGTKQRKRGILHFFRH